MTAKVKEPEIEFLFRYRDLIADTLTEHRKIIESPDNSQGCWWGWWKRPSEDGRPDVWNSLQQQIASNGFAVIGLFNSGATEDSTAVVRARVEEVIVPEKGANGFIAPVLGVEQLELVPEYYRKSPFSRAWLRITDIDSAQSEFFCKYSFSVPPQLPGIPPHYLSRLKGKIIKDREELRAMDTTIWQVRPKNDGDHDEKFLAPGIRITDAVSIEAVKVVGNKILHLTDLHFATGDHRKQHVWSYAGESKRSTLAESVGMAMAGQGIGVVVVTGDFTFMAAEEEFRQAAASMNQLLGSLGLGPDHMVIVPGNHDIQWRKSASEKYKPDAKVESASGEATKNYREFYRRLLQHTGSDSLSMGRRYLFPHGGVVDICGLNSSNLESGKNFLAGMGRVDPTEFARVRMSMGWATRDHHALRLLIMHHHLTATEDVESPAEFSKGFGMAIDAKKILREAAKAGVHLVLHGHRHRVFVWRESVFENPEEIQKSWELGDVSILGGGSAGSNDVIDNKNYFNVLDVSSTAIGLQIYRSKRTSQFEHVQSWKAALTMAEGRPVLASWQFVPDASTK